MLRSGAYSGKSNGPPQRQAIASDPASAFLITWYRLLVVLIIVTGLVLLFVFNPLTTGSTTVVLSAPPPGDGTLPTELKARHDVQALVNLFARTMTRRNYAANVDLFVSGSLIDFHRAFTFMSPGNIPVDLTTTGGWGFQLAGVPLTWATHYMIISNCNITFPTLANADVTCIGMLTYTIQQISMFTTALPTQMVMFQPVFSAVDTPGVGWQLTYANVLVNATNILLDSLDTGAALPGGVFFKRGITPPLSPPPPPPLQPTLRHQAKAGGGGSRSQTLRDLASDTILWNTFQTQIGNLLANNQESTAIAICTAPQFVVLLPTFDPSGDSLGNLCNTIEPPGHPPIHQPVTCTEPGLIDPMCLNLTDAIDFESTAILTNNGITPDPGNQDFTITGGIGVIVSGGMHGITIHAAPMEIGLPPEFFFVPSPTALVMCKTPQAANTVWAGPVSGPDAEPMFRALSSADLVGIAAADDQILIGGGVTGGAGLELATLTAGSGITIVTGGGATTISATAGGGGTVTSVGLAAPAELIVSGSPIATSGTLTLTKADQPANTVWAGPTDGPDAEPTFRALGVEDLGALLGEDEILIGIAGGGVNASMLVGGAGISVSTVGGITTIEAIGGGGGIGTVTSVALGMPSIFAVSGSPVTTTGTLTASLVSQLEGTFFAAPVGGAGIPLFRAMEPMDMPQLMPGHFFVGNDAGETVMSNLTQGAGIIIDSSGGGTTIISATGLVSSVDLALPLSVFAVTSGIITESGTHTAVFVSQSPNTFFAGPSSGGSAVPTFRTLDSDDIPGTLSLDMLTVTGTTFLGTTTSCTSPLASSCYDISGQTCAGGPLATDCFPDDLTLNSLVVHNLTLLSSEMINVGVLTQEAINVTYLEAHNVDLQGPLTCSGDGAIDQGCINLGGAMCPMGMPLSESCIPASLAFINLTATSLLTVSDVACVGGALEDACIPSRVATINGIAPDGALDFTIVGGTGITVTPGVNSVTIDNTGPAGTVTSVGLSAPSAELVVSGSPVTGSGTLTLTKATQLANTVWAGPTSGGAAQPTFRVLGAADFASLLVSDGQLLIGDTGSDPVAATLSAGSFIDITNGAGSIGVAVSTLGTDDIIIGTAGGNVASTLTAGTGISIVTGGGMTTFSATAGGTVTSVGLGMPSIFSVSGSPVTTSGTLSASLVSQSAATFFAAPTGSAGTPTFRTMALGDLPTLPAGELYIGQTGMPPTTATLTAGTLTTIIPGDGTITVGSSLPSIMDVGKIWIGNGGSIPSAATVAGTADRVIVTNGAGSITLSTPQDIHTAATPTFASLSLTAVTNQLTLGTTNTVTVSAAAPSTSRTYTMHDPGANANFVLDTGGALTITNSPNVGDVLVSTSATEAEWQEPTVAEGNVIADGLNYHSATGTTPIAGFTASTFTDVTDLSFTPRNGTWFCLFNSDIEPTAANGVFSCTIAIDGVSITSSERTLSVGSDRLMFGTNSVVIVDGTQVVSAQWEKTSGSGSGTMSNRNLYCQRISA